MSSPDGTAAKQGPCKPGQSECLGVGTERVMAAHRPGQGHMHGRAPGGKIPPDPPQTLEFKTHNRTPQHRGTIPQGGWSESFYANVNQMVHSPYLNILTASQCPSERTPNLYCCLQGPLTLGPSTPHPSTCSFHQATVLGWTWLF